METTVASRLTARNVASETDQFRSVSGCVRIGIGVLVNVVVHQRGWDLERVIRSITM